mgnify:CR=1 FL=1
MRGLILSWILLVLMACAKESNLPSPDSNQTYRYLALGDSYTIGTAIGQDSSYSALLADSLRKSSQDSIFYQVIATNGWTTADLQAGIVEAAPDSNFDLVSILIGVNNQYQGRSITEYRREFKDLALQAIAFADGDPRKVMVFSIPDWGVSPAGSGRNRTQTSIEINAFNAAQKAIADSLNLDFFDITTSSRKGLQDPSLIASDGLHFSAKMHLEWMRANYAAWYQKLIRP